MRDPITPRLCTVTVSSFYVRIQSIFILTTVERLTEHAGKLADVQQCFAVEGDKIECIHGKEVAMTWLHSKLQRINIERWWDSDECRCGKFRRRGVRRRCCKRWVYFRTCSCLRFSYHRNPTSTLDYSFRSPNVPMASTESLRFNIGPFGINDDPTKSPDLYIIFFSASCDNIDDKVNRKET